MNMFVISCLASSVFSSSVRCVYVAERRCDGSRGFQPTGGTPANDPRRGATHEIASERMTPIPINRRSATAVFLGSPFRGLKPTATIEHRSAMICHAHQRVVVATLPNYRPVCSPTDGECFCLFSHVAKRWRGRGQTGDRFLTRTPVSAKARDMSSNDGRT